eukprot:TRINITY_DN6558_c6_g1_i1.p1 TRINITY_DN6558_c6_g1~~TRINITY_DN6558_c6_g1_i1.p1  ORF type:complete len:488 (+),score=19.51 TRINITY_DN6558_c6_g1_i1:90-1466(+)
MAPPEQGDGTVPMPMERFEAMIPAYSAYSLHVDSSQSSTVSQPCVRPRRMPLRSRAATNLAPLCYNDVGRSGAGDPTISVPTQFVQSTSLAAPPLLSTQVAAHAGCGPSHVPTADHSRGPSPEYRQALEAAVEASYSPRQGRGLEEVLESMALGERPCTSSAMDDSSISRHCVPALTAVRSRSTSPSRQRPRGTLSAQAAVVREEGLRARTARFPVHDEPTSLLGLCVDAVVSRVQRRAPCGTTSSRITTPPQGWMTVAATPAGTNRSTSPARISAWHGETAQPWRETASAGNANIAPCRRSPKHAVQGAPSGEGCGNEEELREAVREARREVDSLKCNTLPLATAALREAERDRMRLETEVACAKADAKHWQDRAEQSRRSAALAEEKELATRQALEHAQLKLTLENDQLKRTLASLKASMLPATRAASTQTLALLQDKAEMPNAGCTRSEAEVTRG